MTKVRLTDKARRKHDHFSRLGMLSEEFFRRNGLRVGQRSRSIKVGCLTVTACETHSGDSRAMKARSIALRADSPCFLGNDFRS